MVSNDDTACSADNPELHLEQPLPYFALPGVGPQVRPFCHAPATPPVLEEEKDLSQALGDLYRQMQELQDRLITEDGVRAAVLRDMDAAMQRNRFGA